MSSTEENKIRRMLAREGLILSKGRGQHLVGGFMVLDADFRMVIGGGYPVSYSLTLDEAASYVDWWRQDITV